jgi:hypothetical protein
MTGLVGAGIHESNTPRKSGMEPAWVPWPVPSSMVSAIRKENFSKKHLTLLAKAR